MNPSPVEKLRRNGIQVRHNNDSYLMHHKFAIVDKHCLVNGSLNWTQQAVHGNQENVCIQSSPNTVGEYVNTLIFSGSSITQNITASLT